MKLDNYKFPTVAVGILLVLFNSTPAKSIQMDENFNLPEITVEEDQYSIDALNESNVNRELYNAQADIENLYKAKYNMVNGNLKNARFYLNKIDENRTTLTNVKKRYIAIIEFLEGNFTRSIEALNHKMYFDSYHNGHICLLKLLNYMAINDTEAIKREKDQCISYTINYSKNDEYWLDTMIKLKLKDEKGLRKNMMTEFGFTLGEDEASRIWLKTGLYLNKEKDLLDLIAVLPENSYQSKRIREMIAFLYLRTGTAENKTKALSFVDDIDSANAENIKGSINMQNKEYELAFGHFKLALSKKQDSINSLDRAVPLAWLLNQWKDGLDMLGKNTNKNVDPRNKRAIKAAFLIRDKKYDEAHEELTLLKNEFKNDPPSEISIMDSFVSLVVGAKDKKYDKRKVEDSAEKACRAFDGINCWISLQHILWDNLGKTILREDETFSDSQITIDSMKDKKEIKPLVEISTVDQRDIEELDGKSVKLEIMNQIQTPN
jgi:hypothetical protein